MLKRISVVAAVIAVLFAGGPAAAIVVCDSEGIEYQVKISHGEFLSGTASNIPCGGTARLVGSYTSVPEGFFFTIYIDQDERQVSCCDGFQYIGIWKNGAGFGNWYESQEESPACTDQGTFTISRCGTVPLRTWPALYLPGQRD